MPARLRSKQRLVASNAAGCLGRLVDAELQFSAADCTYLVGICSQGSASVVLLEAALVASC